MSFNVPAENPSETTAQKSSISLPHFMDLVVFPWSFIVVSSARNWTASQVWQTAGGLQEREHAHYGSFGLLQNLKPQLPSEHLFLAIQYW